MLSWEEFLKYAQQMVITSSKIHDKWSLEGSVEETGGAYLKMVTTQMSQDPQTITTMTSDPQEMCPPLKQILRWEYHVYYSLSYSVPVLCFNVWNENGYLLRLDDVWKNCNTLNKCQVPEDMYSVLTQQDHPILSRPFFTLHPCKTHEFLKVSGGKECNLVIKYISSVGPMVNLILDMAYANC